MSAWVRLLVLSAALVCGVMSGARAAESPPIHPAIQAAVDSQERLPKDRARDDNRHYAEIMEFFGVRPGMNVIELFAAGGNTAEVLARAVGPTGKVYMQNPHCFFERSGNKPVEERLANDRLPNVVRLDKPLNELGPSRTRSTARSRSWCCTISSGCRKTCRACSRICTRR